MPRANRCFLPGYAWHITHRCHDRAFLLKSTVCRDNWRQCLYQAKKRYGLSVLNYIVTSNHIHLLVHDANGDETIARSMQLVAGQTAQTYNRRRGRRGAFWEDRYHAVAVESGQHLARCLVYIDLNMVRAGVVEHPSAWHHGGYREIQNPAVRYRVLDLERLAELTECASVEQLRSAHVQWVNEALPVRGLQQDPSWSRAIAVGNEPFIDKVKAELGIAGRKKSVLREADRFVLRESRPAYGPYDRKTAAENRV